MIVPFLEMLLDHGHVRVAHPDQPVSLDELRETEEVLAEYEVIRRQGFPGVPPQFSLPAAVWAAKVFYRACQAATFRDIPAELLPAFLGEECPVLVSGMALATGSVTSRRLAPCRSQTECPAAESPSLHYSVDLVFQFLPDLTKLAGFAMAADPLLEHLRKWANQWPLSSVGMQDVTPTTLPGIVEHSPLLQYYVDRIIARRDKTRLGDAAVRSAMRQRVGLSREMFPEFEAIW